jgi:uracil-DNA glycosylase family 4
MSPAILPEQRRLLDLLEDYYRDGFHRPHPAYEALPAGPKGEARMDAARIDAARPPEAPQASDEARQSEKPQAERPGPADPAARLEAVAREVAACRRCALHRGRRRTVPGEGVLNPKVLVVGEGPGAEEDATGRPFVGKAGQYLDRWLKAIDLDRKANCFITNVVKCRPPGNRDPQPEESGACMPYLREQIAILKPKAILAVGRIAAQVLTGRAAGIGELRSRQYTFGDIPLVVTYHPSAVLRDPSLRAPVWEDLKRLNAVLGHA